MQNPLVIREDFVIGLEWFDGVFWVHMDVFKWNATTKKGIIKELSEIQKLVKMPLRCLARSANPKLQKFALLLGCIVETEITLPDGELAKIYKWG